MPDVTDPAIAALEARARALDAADPLAPFADRFHRVPGTIYLDGS